MRIVLLLPQAPCSVRYLIFFFFFWFVLIFYGASVLLVRKKIYIVICGRSFPQPVHFVLIFLLLLLFLLFCYVYHA